MHKLFYIFTLSLAACTYSAGNTTQSEVSTSIVVPEGFAVVEQSPEAYFIRLSSAEHASASAISELASTLAPKFDRIDLCLDVAHERGDEYLSITDGMVFDYDNNNIYPLDILTR